MTDTFVFDEVSFFRDVEEQAARADKQRENFARTQIEANKAVATSQENLKTTIDLLTSRASEINQETLTSLGKLEEAAAIAPPFRDLVSIFNPELNIDKQRVAVQRGQLELSNVESQVKSAQLSHQLTTQSARTNIESAAAMETLTRAQLESSIKILGLGITIENEAEQDDLDALNAMSTEELNRINAAVKSGDLSTVPANLRNKPGLIEATAQSREFAAMGVTTRELAIATSEIQLKREKISDTLNKFDDTALVEQLRTQVFPENLNKNIITQELNRREKIHENLKALKLGNAAGEFQLGNAIKAEVLNDSTLGELKAAFELAARDPNGMAAIVSGDAQGDFTKEEINNAIIAKQAAFEKITGELAEKAMLVGTAQSADIKNNLEINNISKQLSPGGTFNPNDPISTAPPQVLNLLAENAARLEQLRTMKASLPADSNSVIDPMIAKEIKAMSDKIAAAEKEIVDNVPKEQKKGTTEFLKNGRVVNNRNAGDLLASQAANTEALNHHPIIGDLWKGVSAEFIDLQASVGGRNISLDSISGSFAITNEGKQNAANLLERSLQDTKFRDRASQKFLQKTLAEAILTLQSETRAKDTGASPFDGIVNPTTGIFGPEFFQITPDGKRIFDAQTFNVALSVKNKDLRVAGLLEAGDTLQSMIYQRTSQLTADLNFTDRNLRGDATEASLAAFAFNNNLGQFVRKKLTGLQANVDNAEVKVKQLQNTLEAEVQAITATVASEEEILLGIQPDKAPNNLMEIFQRDRQ